MSDSTPLTFPTLERQLASAPDREAVSHGLTRRAAALALRVADLVKAHGSAEAGAPSAASFLRDWAASTGVTALPAPSTPAPQTPLGELARGLRLSAVELDLLLLAGLPEEHEGLASTMSTLHPRGEPRPTVGLAVLVVQDDIPDRAGLRRLLHEGQAARSGLLEVTGEGTFFERSLTVADQVWEALHGSEAWPGSLNRVEVMPPPAGLQGWLDLPAVARAVTTIGQRQSRLLIIGSADTAIAMSRVSALAQAAGRAAVAARFRPDATGAAALLGLHAALRGGVPVVLVEDRPDATPPSTPDLGRLIGPVLACAEPGAIRPPVDRPVLIVPLGPIRMADRRAAWQGALPGVGPDAARLAARHPLDPAVTALVARDVDGHNDSNGGPVDLATVSSAIRARAGVALPAGVDLLIPRAGWGRLVLDDDSAAQLRSAVARLEHQHLVLDEWGMAEIARADRGVRLLFSGPPGTGKSLAAEVVAGAVATDLLVVDVSRVVSKWLGETEKNLAAVFDVAERTQAVLFLDEADALFAARTSVSDAHDRYANLETAWLLQRLDRFDGLAVLATNLRRNIDPAFLRRMDYVIEFILPDEASRAGIWDRHLPGRLRAADVDLPLLARLYPMPGAWIRNSAIGAAFRAAADGDQVRLGHLVSAIRREYAKAAKPFPGEPPSLASGDRDERAVRLLAGVVPGSTGAGCGNHEEGEST